MNNFGHSGYGGGAPGGLLEVHVIEAINVPKADKLSQSDPFVEVRWGSQVEKTTVVKNNANPRWDQKFQFHIQDPNTDQLRFILYDKDTLGKNKKLGGCACQINTLHRGKPSDCRVDLKTNPPCTLHITLLATNFGLDSGTHTHVHEEVRQPVHVAPVIAAPPMPVHESPVSSFCEVPAPAPPPPRAIPVAPPIMAPPVPVYQPRRDERLLAEYRRAKQRRAQLCREYEAEMCDAEHRRDALLARLAHLEHRERELDSQEHYFHHHDHHHHDHHVVAPHKVVERHHFVYDEDDVAEGLPSTVHQTPKSSFASHGRGGSYASAAPHTPASARGSFVRRAPGNAVGSTAFHSVSRSRVY